MITFKQYIFELGDTKVKSELLRQSKTAFGREAIIGDRKIRFVASAEDNDGITSWDVAFVEVTYGKYGLVDRDYAKTGNGKEFEVGAFVVDAFKEFLSIYNPEQVYFSADKEDGKDNRARLYAKMASKLLKNYKRLDVDSHKSQERFLYQRSDII